MEVNSLKTEEFKKLNTHRTEMESVEERRCKPGKNEWRMFPMALIK